MFAIDEYVTALEDAKLGIIAIWLMLQWPSTRGLSLSNIAGQLGCSPTTITRACARFREMSGPEVSAGGVRFIRPGAGSGGDKPAALRVWAMLPKIPALSRGEIDPIKVAMEFFFDRLRLVECRLRLFDV
jgi:hypothetical protein